MQIAQRRNDIYIQEYYIDDNGCILCPDCHTLVRVGNGGVENFKKRHLSSKACTKNAQKNQKTKKATAGFRTLGTWFSSKQNPTLNAPTVAEPAPVQASSSALIDNTQSIRDAHSPLTGHDNTTHELSAVTALDEEAAIIHDSVPPMPSTPGPTLTSPLVQPCQHALRLISKLRDVARNLPVSIPEGVLTDKMACFSQHWPVPDHADEAWEVLDPILNGVLGWGRTADDVAHDIRRGVMGLDGLLAMVEHFVMGYGIRGSLLEGKMDILFKGVQIA